MEVLLTLGSAEPLAGLLRSQRKVVSCFTCVCCQDQKKLAKEAQRERRRSKVPKHVKKRKEKTSKMKKGR